MTKKEKFIEMVEVLIEGAQQPMDEDAISYFEKLKEPSVSKKVEMTENGKNIIDFMQKNEEEVNNLFKSKDVAEGMFVSSRSVSGAMRKLVTDGYVDKTDDSPIVYSLTEEGRTYSI